MAHILVAGHFGCGNLGDDSILLGFAEGLGQSRIDLTVMAGSPEEVQRNYGLRAIPRKDMGAYTAELDRVNAVVFAGGSIFQDVTSVRSALFYANLVKKAKKAGKKVYLVGQGVGPLTKFLSKRASLAAYNLADAVVVRDPASAQTLKDLGLRRPIQIGADLAFLMPPPPQVGEEANFSNAGRTWVALTPRPCGKNTKDLVACFGEFARMLSQNNFLPIFIPMDRNEDIPFIQAISDAQGGKIPDLRKVTTPSQLQARVARMETVVAMRLHAGILASTVGVPPLMVSYDPKVAAFAKLLDLGNAIPVEGLTPQRLFENFQDFAKNREKHTQNVERRRQDMIRQAMVSVQVVVEGVLGSPVSA